MSITLVTASNCIATAEMGATTPRERYRTQVHAEIKERAWEQIATTGHPHSETRTAALPTAPAAARGHRRGRCTARRGTARTTTRSKRSLRFTGPGTGRRPRHGTPYRGSTGRAVTGVAGRHRGDPPDRRIRGPLKGVGADDLRPGRVRVRRVARRGLRHLPRSDTEVDRRVHHADAGTGRRAGQAARRTHRAGPGAGGALRIRSGAGAAGASF